MDVAPPRPRNMVLPVLRGLCKRMVQRDEGLDRMRGGNMRGTEGTCLHADEGAIGIVDCAID